MALTVLTPLEILPSPANECANLDGKRKVEFVNDLHVKV